MQGSLREARTHAAVVHGDMELVSEAIALTVPPYHRVGVGEACSAVVGVLDAPGLVRAQESTLGA